MAETGVVFYSLYELIIEVRWEGEGIEDELEQFFSSFPFTRLGWSGHAADITLHFAATDTPLKTHHSKVAPLSFYDLSIYDMGGSVYLSDGLSSFYAQPQAGIGQVTLYGRGKESCRVSKHNLFLVGLFHLLPYQNLYHLHAAGLVRGETGYLFIGESGSGKSSLSLSLVRQGWRYLSDDVLLFRPSMSGVEALSFRKRFFLDPALSRHYHEISAHLEETPYGDDTKQLFDVESVYPDQFSSNCFPRILIFTRIVPHAESALVPIDRASVLVRLMQQSATLFFNRQVVRAHAEALKRLLYQTTHYQLFAGVDLREDPAKISEILGCHERCSHHF